jgi:hypothetical protein
VSYAWSIEILKVALYHTFLIFLYSALDIVFDSVATFEGSSLETCRRRIADPSPGLAPAGAHLTVPVSLPSEGKPCSANVSDFSLSMAVEIAAGVMGEVDVWAGR